MPGRKVLVTGAAGFIGSHLVERLLADGHEVVGIDSFEDFYPREAKEANIAATREHPAFTLVQENILALGGAGAADAGKGAAGGTGRSRLAELVASADVVFHLAAQPGVRASWGRDFRIYTDNNVLATQVLLEASRDAGLERFVYASTSSVYGDTDVLPMREDATCRPYSPYGVSKLAAENLCYLYFRNFGLATVALRYFTVYGPRQRPDMGFCRFIRWMLEGRPIEVYGDGHQTRDFTYVSDIVEGTLSAMSAPAGETFNLGGGSRVSLLDALHALEEVAGTKLELDVKEKQAGDVRHTWASLDKSREVLGYEPKVALAEGLAAELEWLKGR